jgi:hypothetical protein
LIDVATSGSKMKMEVPVRWMPLDLPAPGDLRLVLRHIPRPIRYSPDRVDIYDC